MSEIINAEIVLGGAGTAPADIVPPTVFTVADAVEAMLYAGTAEMTHRAANVARLRAFGRSAAVTADVLDHSTVTVRDIADAAKAAWSGSKHLRDSECLFKSISTVAAHAHVGRILRLEGDGIDLGTYAVKGHTIVITVKDLQGWVQVKGFKAAMLAEILSAETTQKGAAAALRKLVESLKSKPKTIPATDVADGDSAGNSAPDSASESGPVSPEDMLRNALRLVQGAIKAGTWSDAAWALSGEIIDAINAHADADAETVPTGDVTVTATVVAEVRAIAA